MQTVKWVQIKLFYNQSTRTHYIQIGESLIAIKTMLALAIADKNGLEVRNCLDLKDMQIISLEDDKKDTKDTS